MQFSSEAAASVPESRVQSHARRTQQAAGSSVGAQPLKSNQSALNRNDSRSASHRHLNSISSRPSRSYAVSVPSSAFKPIEPHLNFKQGRQREMTPYVPSIFTHRAEQQYEDENTAPNSIRSHNNHIALPDSLVTVQNADNAPLSEYANCKLESYRNSNANQNISTLVREPRDDADASQSLFETCDDFVAPHQQAAYIQHFSQMTQHSKHTNRREFHALVRQRIATHRRELRNARMERLAKLPPKVQQMLYHQQLSSNDINSLHPTKSVVASLPALASSSSDTATVDALLATMGRNSLFAHLSMLSYSEFMTRDEKSHLLEQMSELIEDMNQNDIANQESRLDASVAPKPTAIQDSNGRMIHSATGTRNGLQHRTKHSADTCALQLTRQERTELYARVRRSEFEQERFVAHSVRKQQEKQQSEAARAARIELQLHQQQASRGAIQPGAADAVSRQTAAQQLSHAAHRKSRANQRLRMKLKAHETNSASAQREVVSQLGLAQLRRQVSDRLAVLPASVIATMPRPCACPVNVALVDSCASAPAALDESSVDQATAGQTGVDASTGISSRGRVGRLSKKASTFVQSKPASAPASGSSLHHALNCVFASRPSQYLRSFLLLLQAVEDEQSLLTQH